MPRGLTIIAAVLLLGASGASGVYGASAAQSRSSSRVPCGPSGATTLAASHQARVYVSAGTAYGCARGGRRHIRLGARRTCLGTARIDPVVVTGALAAYGSETCGVDAGTTNVVVRRLTDGRQLRSAPATGPVGPESYASVTSLVLRSDGAVAWIGQGQSIGTRRRVVEVWRSDRHGLARLGSGARICARSLRLRGATLQWRDGTGTRTATLS